MKDKEEVGRVREAAHLGMSKSLESAIKLRTLMIPKGLIERSRGEECTQNDHRKEDKSEHGEHSTKGDIEKTDTYFGISIFPLIVFNLLVKILPL